MPEQPPRELDPALEARKNGAWREVAAIEAAFELGELDAAGWHRAMAAIFVPAYLAGDNPRAQSGFGGDERRWEGARRPILAAVDRDGTFLDVGCASGYLMESLHRWAAADGRRLELSGLDIAPELAALARRRLPHWADRIFVGNALHWPPPRRFTFVRTGLEYVPRALRPRLIARLLAEVVEPGGRLIVGTFNEEAGPGGQAAEVAAWGFPVAGQHEVPHPDDPPDAPQIVRRVYWLDAPGEARPR